jgi:hypothetical protein
MSLLQVAVAPSRAWARVAVDTSVSGDDREVSKVYALPHLNAVIAARGLHIVCCAAASAANTGLRLDELMEHMPKILEQQREQMAEILKKTGVASRWLETPPNVALIAWRPEGVVARVWNGYYDPQHAVYDVPAGGSYASPCYSLDDPMHCLTPGQMENVARQQVEYARGLNDPDVVIGGSLLMATVDRAGTRIGRIAQLT